MNRSISPKIDITSSRYNSRRSTNASPYKLNLRIQENNSDENSIGIITKIRTPLIKEGNIRIKQASDKRTEMFKQCYMNALQNFRNKS